MNLKVVLPLGAIFAAILLSAVLIGTTSPVASVQSERVVRSVRVVSVTSRTVQLEVRSQGTVSPRTESELIPEVSGRVVWTSSSLVSGGYFQEGEALLRLDRTDYGASVKRARAALARARGENKHAQQTLKRQRDLKKRNVVSTAALDDAERVAEVSAAGYAEARLVLEQAERDLARTELVAPFDGRVREKRVDVGQFVNRGTGFATLYATDFVEVKLPIPDAQLAYLDVPLWSREAIAEADLPEVTLRARFAGRDHEWVGRLVRTEGEIDAKSRLVNVVARVENGDGAEAKTPLPVGLFVQASVQGRAVEGVTVVPRQALRDGSRVLLVDDENRLRYRAVEVLRIEGDEALIASGVSDGERVCVSAIQAPVDGMTVRPVADAPAELKAEDGA